MILDFNTMEAIPDEKEEKKENIFEKAKEKLSNGIQWVKEHPTEFGAILTGGAALMTGANKIVKGVNRTVTARQERYNKERFIYDHSLNAYLETNRKLTNNDIVRINAERRRTGKKLSEVLAEMHLLK